ncbi:hypothetical protein BDY24DRAFT_397092 [Mrakia frigida]|uniref:uncharacterized protein n=1 Tax=Mrakia frigida TaxID=29902 RepID=UPI003FCC2687
MSTSKGFKSEPRDSLEAALPISNEQAQQDDQAQPPPSFPSQSQPDLKPSSPPATTTSFSSKPIWPETYLLFLDPLSTIAIPRILQHLSVMSSPVPSSHPLSPSDLSLPSSCQKLTDGNPPRLTTVLLEASHIVIDPSSMFGDAVLEQQAQSQIQKPSDFKPQLVVTDRWLRECILWSNWEEEAEYLFTGSKKEEVKVKKEEGGTGKGKGKGREGVKREKEDVEDEDDGELPTRGRWLESEHDALARFLLPLHDYTLRDENGRDAFEAFAETEQTRRSANACREHYRSWEDTYKARLVELRGGTGLGKTRGETEGKGKGKGRAARESSSSESDLDLDSDSDSDDEDAKEPVRQRGLGRGNGIRIWYTDQEESDLKECLRTSSTPTEAFKKMSDLHPRRTFNSIRKRYHNRKDQYESLLAPGSRSGTYHWTTSEELDLVRLLSKPHASVTEVCRAFHAQVSSLSLLSSLRLDAS